jgi:hypothetical protein
MHFAPQPPPLIDTNGQPVDQSLPSEAIIKQLGVEAPPDQTPAQQMTESVAPFVVPTANTISRFQEAAGPLNKVLTFGRSGLGGVADWIAANAAQEWAKQQGYSDEAQQILGSLGPTARNFTSRTAGYGVHKLFGGGEEGGKAYDVNRDVDVTPPAGSVSGPSVSTYESGLGGLPFAGAPVSSARKAQTEAIGQTADAGVEALAPGATPVTEGGPGTVTKFAENLSNQAREEIFNRELELKARADALEAPINNVRVNAQPVLDAAMDVASDPNVSKDVRDAATTALHNIQASVDPATGTIGWQALKQTRTGLGAIVDRMFPPLSGGRTIKRTIGASLQPVEDAMTASLGDAADQAGAPGWRQLDADWRVNSRMQRDLTPIAGKLGDIEASPQASEWTSAPSANTVANDLKGAVQGNQPYIDAIGRGLGQPTAAQTVAETIAAKGRPQSGARTTEFRPDTFGTRYDAEVGEGTKSFIRGQPQGSEALDRLERAAAAGRTVGEPREPGNLAKTIGGIVAAAAPYAIGGPVIGTAAHLGASAIEDPSFVRSLAGRGFTPENAPPLVQQYMTRGGLGAVPQPPDILPRVWNAAASAPSGVLGALMPYLMPGR